MQVLLEIFFLKMTADTVIYHRHDTDVTDMSNDPDDVVLEFAKREIGKMTDATDRNFVLHSTSWRHKHGAIILTYIVYSEMFAFEPEVERTLNVDELSAELINGESHKILEIEESCVVSHAIRHLGFLVKNDSKGKYAKAINSENTEKLKAIYPTLAGRI